MITLRDCEAFCDAEPNWVREMACRECLTMVQAYAGAHALAVCARQFAPGDAENSAALTPLPGYRQAVNLPGLHLG